MSKNVVDFSLVLKDLDGNDIRDRSGAAQVAQALLDAGISQMLIEQALAMLKPFWGSGEEPKVVLLTACRACANALQASDPNLGGAERVDRMRLAIKLMDSKPVEITETEKVTILKAVEKAYPGPLVYFRIHELFGAA